MISFDVCAKCLWKSKTPKELGGGIQEAEDMVGSPEQAETCLTSKFPLLWKNHWVSHIPAESRCPQITPEGVLLEFCGVQLNWSLLLNVTELEIMVFKQPSFFFQVLDKLFIS